MDDGDGARNPVWSERTLARITRVSLGIPTITAAWHAVRHDHPLWAQLVFSVAALFVVLSPLEWIAALVRPPRE